MTLSKRMKAVNAAAPRDCIHTPRDAIQYLQKVSLEYPVKFEQSVDVAIRLGIDPRKSDQMVRGAKVLPHGIGRSVRVAVFAEGEQAEKARMAGADVVGFEDLADSIKNGSKFDCDVVIATPNSMKIVGPLGTFLGPRGLMPNPKMGTVTTDLERAIKEAKLGQARYRADKSGVVHCRIGNISFDAQAILENFLTLLTDLKRMKPSTSKGQYIKKIFLSTTMGPGLEVDAQFEE